MRRADGIRRCKHRHHRAVLFAVQAGRRDGRCAHRMGYQMPIRIHAHHFRLIAAETVQAVRLAGEAHLQATFLLLAQRIGRRTQRDALGRIVYLHPDGRRLSVVGNGGDRGAARLHALDQAFGIRCDILLVAGLEGTARIAALRFGLEQGIQINNIAHTDLQRSRIEMNALRLRKHGHCAGGSHSRIGRADNADIGGTDRQSLDLSGCGVHFDNLGLIGGISQIVQSAFRVHLEQCAHITGCPRHELNRRFTEAHALRQGQHSNGAAC